MIQPTTETENPHLLASSNLLSCNTECTVAVHRTLTNCDILALNKEDLDTVLETYPQLREQIMRVADEQTSCLKDFKQASARDGDKVL